MSRRTRPSYAYLLFMLDMGPYRLRVELVPKAQLRRKNENSETDYNAAWLRIADHLAGKQLIEAFLVRLVEIIHYTHGLDDTSTEEHFTHSFAAGVLEFASRNKAAWLWLNSQFSSLAANAPFKEFASGSRRWRARAPREVYIGPYRIDLATMTGVRADKEGVWGYYHYRYHLRGVLLHEELTGRHLAVIILHELTHAFHHVARVKTRETRRRFMRLQARAWLEFVLVNPDAWCWFLHLLRSRRAKARNLWPIESSI